jgi:uncharacterized ion transporter superfamily protein YfcC
MLGLILLFTVVITAGVYIYKAVKDGDIDEVELDIVTEVEKEEAAIQAVEQKLDESMKTFAVETRAAMKKAIEESKKSSASK